MALSPTEPPNFTDVFTALPSSITKTIWPLEIGIIASFEIVITELGLLEGINIFTEALFALRTFLILSLKLKRTVLVPVLGFSLNKIAL